MSSGLVSYSELWRSYQGEGLFTGRNTLWLRYWGCPLTCSGFGQKDPTDPTTYIKPWGDVDFDKIVRLEDLPVLDKGCDSAYSHELSFKKFMKRDTVADVASQLRKLLVHPLFNPKGKFRQTDICFTGGEPMMHAHQRTSMALLERLAEKDDLPFSVTFETNGMFLPVDGLLSSLTDFVRKPSHFSISPKLFTVSGEKSYRGSIIAELVQQAQEAGHLASLKFVLSEEERAWQEMYDLVRDIAEHMGGDIGELPMYIMPVGGSTEQQCDPAVARIADRAVAEGYHLAARVQAYVHGNSVGK